MDTMTEIKAAFVGCVTAVFALMGAAGMPVLVMVCTSMGDYITGIAAAKFRGQKIDVRIAAHGIVRKICQWLLVAVGAVLDWLVAYMGFKIPVSNPIVILVAVWIIANELISILENLRDIGVPLPPYLMKIAELIKTKAKADVPETEENEHE